MRPQPPRCISVPHPNSKPFPTLLCSGPSCQDLGPEPPGPLLLITCSRRPFPASALRGCSRCAPSPQCSSPAGPIVRPPNTPRSPRARRLLRYASSNLSTSGVWGRVVLWASQGLQQHPRPPPVVSLGKTAEHVQRPASSDLWELRPSPWPTGPAGPRPPRVQHERPLFPLPPAVRVRALPTTRGGRQRGASGHAPGVHPTPPPLCCPLPDLASSLPRHKLSYFVSLFVDGFISFLAPRSRGLSLPSALVPQDPKQGRGVGNPGPQTSRRDGGFSRV